MAASPRFSAGDAPPARSVTATNRAIEGARDCHNDKTTPTLFEADAALRLSPGNRVLTRSAGGIRSKTGGNRSLLHHSRTSAISFLLKAQLSVLQARSKYNPSPLARGLESQVRFQISLSRLRLARSLRSHPGSVGVCSRSDPIFKTKHARPRMWPSMSLKTKSLTITVPWQESVKLWERLDRRSFGITERMALWRLAWRTDVA